ncbi:lipopolysaccharide cholinephosphotransferase [Butyrivibrio sp. ob235]|uniref:LicD family protein n=1 Tax=Butyrivibrio sp. ob235 TaxID=1761780 RepID=UPI0008B9A54B|nr:LicD family protein [Butyrivibrio sp. ob235]SEL81942.1 lipopolysaccharide cholinephosphotransferase [Butyrivibrio sp. ob235]
MGSNKAIGAKDRRHFFKTGFRGAPGTFELSEEQLKKLQSTLLDMLKDFIEVFENEKIFYTLSGGSVLGSIRHKGFIPWDDDIDINMPRKDFEHLKKVFDKRLGDKYVLCGPEFGRGYGMSHVQIKKKGTVYKAFNELTMEDTGIFIDIFVLENTYDSPLKRKIHGTLCLIMGYVLTCRKTAEDWKALEPYLSVNEVLKGAFLKKKRIGSFFKFISLDKVAKRVGYWYSYCGLGDSELVCIPSGRKHYFGEMYRREDMCESREAVFEGVKVRIPKGTERYMEILYGPEYMEIPPVEDREIHSAVELDFGAGG